MGNRDDSTEPPQPASGAVSSRMPDVPPDVAPETRRSYGADALDADHDDSGEVDGEAGGLDPDRARLIGSIYEVVLHPEHFDDFILDWAGYIEQAARRLDALQLADGQSAHLLDDPTVVAHFQRAFSLFERMGRGDEPPILHSGADLPLMRLERGGAVSQITPRAKLLFGRAPDLAAICEALEYDSAQRLHGFLSSFERAPASGRFAVLSLAKAPDPGAAPPVPAGSSGGDTPASDTLPGGGLLGVITRRNPDGDGFIVELLSLSIHWSPALAQILADAFHLTPREIELLRELTMGGDLPAIAQRMERSLNTLRAQLKSIFAKTRTNAQAELMRLVSVLVMHGPNAQTPAEPLAQSGRELRIDLGDGRFMPVHVAGPEDGLPVVFIHGMLEGLGILRHIEPYLIAAGLRLIAPVRSNFGQAMADPRIREAPAQFAKDLCAVLRALEVPRCVVCGHMAGGLYAYAAAGRLREVVAGIVNVAGCVPIKSIEQFAAMTPRQRAIAYTARFAPALLPAVLRAGIARIDSRDVKAFMEPLYPAGYADRKTIGNPRTAAAMIDGYRFTVAQGPTAFQIDAWHVTRDWSALVAQSDCSLLLIHGTRDPAVSFDSVAAFAAATPRANLQEKTGDGQLLFYSQPAAVVSAIARFARHCLEPR